MLNVVWDMDTLIVRENLFFCYDRVGFNKMLESVKFLNDLDRRYLLLFVYSRFVFVFMEGYNFVEFDWFVKKLYGKLKINFNFIIIVLSF